MIEKDQYFPPLNCYKAEYAIIKKKKHVTNSNTTEMERLDDDQERGRGETKLYSWREEGEKDARGWGVRVREMR